MKITVLGNLRSGSTWLACTLKKLLPNIVYSKEITLSSNEINNNKDSLKFIEGDHKIGDFDWLDVVKNRFNSLCLQQENFITKLQVNHCFINNKKFINCWSLQDLEFVFNNSDYIFYTHRDIVESLFSLNMCYNTNIWNGTNQILANFFDNLFIDQNKFEINWILNDYIITTFIHTHIYYTNLLMNHKQKNFYIIKYNENMDIFYLNFLKKLFNVQENIKNLNLQVKVFSNPCYKNKFINNFDENKITSMIKEKIRLFIKKNKNVNSTMDNIY